DAAAITTRRPIQGLQEKMQKRTVTTGCGQGTVFGSLMEEIETIRLREDVRLSEDTLYGLLDAVRRHETIYKSAGAVHGCALADGQGRRMGGVDKGLKRLRDKPMVQWALERFSPQVEELLINANQNLDAYGAYGHRVIPDAITGYAGPLAGLHRALAEAQHD